MDRENSSVPAVEKTGRINALLEDILDSNLNPFELIEIIDEIQLHFNPNN